MDSVHDCTNLRLRIQTFFSRKALDDNASAENLEEQGSNDGNKCEEPECKEGICCVFGGQEGKPARHSLYSFLDPKRLELHLLRFRSIIDGLSYMFAMC